MAGPFETDLSYFSRPVQGSTSGESLASLLESGQRRQAQAYQMQRQRSMADLVARNAGNYTDPMAQAYAGGGFGEEAQQAQQQSFTRQQAMAAMEYQRQQRAMEIQEQQARVAALHRNLTASRLAGISTQEDFDKIAAGLPEDYGLQPGQDFKEAVPRFRQSLVTPEQEAQNKLAEMRYGRPIIKDNALGQIMAVDPTTREAVIVDANKRPIRPGGAAGSKGVPTSALTPGAMDLLVENGFRSGKEPNFGRDYAKRDAYRNRMFELHPDADLVGNSAALHANEADLRDAQKVAGTTDVNEGKAIADLKIMQDKMKPLFNSGSPFLNTTIRGLQNRTGDPQVAAFLVSRAAAVATVNKVLNSQTLTESARHEAQELLREDLTPAQFNASVDVLMQDMERSKEATHKRVDEARSRIAGKAAGSAPGGVLATKTGKDGKKYEKTAEGWHEVTGG